MSISTRSFKIAGGRYPTMLPAIVTFTSRFSIGPLLQICARPPSTNNSIPVIKLLSSDARNVTAFATSSGLPILPSVMVLRSLFFTCSPPSLSTMPLVIGVSIGPGLMALTRILRCFRSTVQERAKDRMAALVAP